MVLKLTSSLPLYCFLLIISILHTTPRELTPRQLQDLPPYGNGTNNSSVHELNKAPSKGEVYGSVSRRAGSATGHSTPSGPIQMPPPTAVTTVTYESGSPPEDNNNNGNNNGNENSNNNNNEQNGNSYWNPPANHWP